MEPYLGEIRAFAGNFAPRGFALCNGQPLSIAEYNALFALLGTTYGGDGQTTFNLPDLRGRLLLNQGQGPGLTIRVLGEIAGTETVTLNTTQMPAHNHPVGAVNTPANQSAPTNNRLAAPVNITISDNNMRLYLPDTAATKTIVPLDNATVSFTGGNQPHNNLMPVVAISYIIALEGIFPSPN